MMWGDLIQPSVEMAEKADVHYQCYDFLSEFTMSLLYRLRQRSPLSGYPTDVVEWNKRLLPIAIKKGIRLVSNGGGANPEIVADEILYVAQALEVPLKLGVVTGDDVLDTIKRLRKEGMKFPNTDTGEEDITSIEDKVIGAHAYIGADQIIEALKAGCDEIVGGRFSDNALYVGPMMYEFGWEYKEPYWNKIGAAITAGHIVESSRSCCGAMSSIWREIPEPWHPGYPIVEMNEDGTAVITKTPDTGGLVNRQTIREQLVYEILDPRNYIMPDGIADLTTLHLEDMGQNRVRITNMTGKPRPDKLKVGVGFHGGFLFDVTVHIVWPDVLEKARMCKKHFQEWLKWANVHPLEWEVQIDGVNMCLGPTVSVDEIEEKYGRDIPEIGVRFATKWQTREEAEFFRRELGRVWSIFPGLPFGQHVPPAPIRITTFWPTLIPRSEVHPALAIKEGRLLGRRQNGSRDTKDG